MRVVHIVHSYFPRIGGIERAVQFLAEAQTRLGHEVHVVTSKHGADDNPSEEVLNNVRVHRIDAWRLHYPDLTVPKVIPGDVLRGADIIHAHGHNSLFCAKILNWGSKHNMKTACYFVGVDYLKNHYNPLIRLFGYHYQKIATRRLAALVNLAIVTNAYERKVLRERYGLDSVVLPHGVSEHYLDMPSMAKKFRNRYGIDERIIAFIGRLHPTKGLDLLIKAFAEVAKKELDVILVIAGRGEVDYLKKCMKLTRDLSLKSRVKYLGYISEEDKIGLIDSSEFVVIPSRHAGESYPLIVDEVKARGKPLVVTNYGVLPHRVANLVEGVVVNADAHSLARGLLRALSNRRSFRILSRPLTWKEVANKLLNLYQSIIE